MQQDKTIKPEHFSLICAGSVLRTLHGLTLLVLITAREISPAIIPISLPGKPKYGKVTAKSQIGGSGI